MIRMQNPHSQVAVNVSVEADLHPIETDATRLKQVLINLISNAVKFTPAGGKVDIAAVNDGAGGCRISVADNGIGMAAENIPLAMAPFGQIESVMARRYPGTGLGLPLAKRLVELMGGTFEINSALGSGTVVSITLPRKRAREAGKTAAAA
jgi:signal transduction histidine kinase